MTDTTAAASGPWWEFCPCRPCWACGSTGSCRRANGIAAEPPKGAAGDDHAEVPAPRSKRRRLAATAAAGFVAAGLVAVGFDAEEVHVFSGVGTQSLRPRSSSSNHNHTETTHPSYYQDTLMRFNRRKSGAGTSDRGERKNDSPMGDNMSMRVGQRRPLPFAEDRYLLFYPHAGYTNQIMALGKAAELARLVNRTLVLPPVLPHCPDPPMKYAWGCTPNNKPEKATGKAVANAFETVVGGRQRFPSFTEIINFDLFPTEYRFVDMPDFMDMFLEYHGFDGGSKQSLVGNRAGDAARVVKRLMLEHFHIGNEFLPLHELMYSKPGMNHNKNVRAMFRDNFMEHRIAVIGSCFGLNLAESHMMREEPLVSPFVQPTDKFLSILGHILRHLGTGYIAAHIRLPDIYAWNPEELASDCSQQKDMVEVYSNLFRKIEKTIMNNTGSGGGGVIYLGSNLSRAKECFQTISKWYNERKKLEGGVLAGETNSTGSTDAVVIRAEKVVTLNDVLADNPGNVLSLMDQIQLEDSTKELVLDQLLLGVGRALVTESALPGGGSTYAWMLRVRHDYRDEVLSRVGGGI